MTTTRVRPWHWLKQRMYRGGRPGPLARTMNAVAAWQYAHGVLTVGGRGVTLEVRGRASGRSVRVPLVLVRQHGERYLVSMLGTDAQWVRNVLAAGGCHVRTRGHDVALTEPRLVHDPARSLVPAPVRVVLGAVGVEDFVVLRRA